MPDKKPAYPVQVFPDGSRPTADGLTGLTRRELFAAMAMQGLCANPSFFGPQFQQNPVAAAYFGVEAADALIAELDVD